MSPSSRIVLTPTTRTMRFVPRLWSETIGAHRREVREAILDTTAALAAECGPLSVTMSQIAEAAGIGRATLYKYFPDVEAILQAWHERHVDGHLQRLSEISNGAGDVRQRLEAVLAAYALICRQQAPTDVAGLLHRGVHVAGAERRLTTLIQSLLTEATETGNVRGDIPVGELATYCIHALHAATCLPSRAATRRLIDVVIAGLQPGP